MGGGGGCGGGVGAVAGGGAGGGGGCGGAGDGGLGVCDGSGDGVAGGVVAEVVSSGVDGAAPGLAVDAGWSCSTCCAGRATSSRGRNVSAPSGPTGPASGSAARCCLAAREAALLGDVADGLHVVAVGVVSKGAVVAGVVLGPQPWLVQDGDAGGQGASKRRARRADPPPRRPRGPHGRIRRRRRGRARRWAGCRRRTRSPDRSPGRDLRRGQPAPSRRTRRWPRRPGTGSRGGRARRGSYDPARVVGGGRPV